MNNKFKNYTPTFLSILFIIGITVGYYFGKRKSLYSIDLSKYSKIYNLLETIQEYYVDSINVYSLIEKIIPKILEQLDPFSIYISPNEKFIYQDELEDEFEGIGIEFLLINDTINVINVLPNGPAHKAGILQGDKIIKINDINVANVGISNLEVIKKLRGPKNTSVKVTIIRDNEKDLMDFSIVRDKIPVVSVDAGLKIGDVGYIKISKFALNTYKEFYNKLKSLKSENIKKFIIDLRGNSGGFMEQAILIANEFLEKNDIIVMVKKRGKVLKKYTANGKGIAKKDNVIIIIDEYSASASEIFAGAIQDNDRGLVIGKKSYGKGLIQQEFPFLDGSYIRLTTARYYTPSGRCIQKPYKSFVDYILNYLDYDTTKIMDTIAKKKFFTKRKKRVVYEDGGITPDIIIEDTINISDFEKQILKDYKHYKFVLYFSNKYKHKINDINFFFLNNSDSLLLQELRNYFKVEEENFKFDKYFLRFLKLKIIKNLFNQEQFYNFFVKTDTIVKYALKIFDENFFEKNFF